MKKGDNNFGTDPTTDDPDGHDDYQSENQLTLPVNRPVNVILRSQDVIHAFYVPEFRMYQDIVPGPQDQLGVVHAGEGRALRAGVQPALRRGPLQHAGQASTWSARTITTSSSARRAPPPSTPGSRRSAPRPPGVECARRGRLLPAGRRRRATLNFLDVCNLISIWNKSLPHPGVLSDDHPQSVAEHRDAPAPRVFPHLRLVARSQDDRQAVPVRQHVLRRRQRPAGDARALATGVPGSAGAGHRPPAGDDARPDHRHARTARSCRRRTTCW